MNQIKLKKISLLLKGVEFSTIMPKAEIIAIGTELLLGDIVDTNTPYIAKLLRNYGIDIFFTSTVGDNPQRIAKTIQEAFERSDIVISTGGLGPTIDDPTRQAASIAFNSELVFNDIAWTEIIERFKKFGKYPTENNKQQAFFPKIANHVENPVGTAPIFYITNNKNKIYIALPGVPSETEFLMDNKVIPLLKDFYSLDTVLISKILHTSGIGESSLDMEIAEFEKLSNPTVGLAAKIGRVDIRITAKAKNEKEANEMINKVESQIRDKVGDSIFGADDNDIFSLLTKKLSMNKLKLGIIESGFSLNLINFYSKNFNNVKNAMYFDSNISEEKLKTLAIELINNSDSNFVIASTLSKGNPNNLKIVFFSKNIDILEKHSFHRPEDQVIDWAINICNNSLLELELN
jgi:competence/damage-inducible protein CinA-like protein